MLDSSMNTLYETYKLLTLGKEATCFKNPENLKYIDLILTKKHPKFSAVVCNRDRATCPS